MKLAQHEIPPAEIHRPDTHNPRVYMEADARGDRSGVFPAKVFSGDVSPHAICHVVAPAICRSVLTDRVWLQSQARVSCPVIYGLANAPFEPIYTREPLRSSAAKVAAEICCKSSSSLPLPVSFSDRMLLNYDYRHGCGRAEGRGPAEEGAREPQGRPARCRRGGSETAKGAGCEKGGEVTTSRPRPIAD